MWLRKGDQVVLVPEHMPETISRCLSDGWAAVADPRIEEAAALPSPQPEIVTLTIDGEQLKRAVEHATRRQPMRKGRV